MAELLPIIYGNSFGRSLGLSKDVNGNVGGPYLRFVQAVAIEFGTSIAPETIAEYLKEYPLPSPLDHT